MFSFFKSKKTLLSELIPPNSVDIHSHLLPGIDDGAKSIADTTYLTTELNNIGFTDFITTPHIITGVWNNSKASIEETLTRNKHIISSYDSVNTFRAAAEYMMDSSFLRRIESEPLLTLKEDFVLVEMSYRQPPIQLYDIIFELQVAGYKPVLAHPERYNFFHNDFESYKKLKKNGCKFQLNILSTVGYYGKEVAKVAEKLLADQYIDYVGTDVHHERHVKAFQSKVVIKSTDLLQKALERNHFFI